MQRLLSSHAISEKAIPFPEMAFPSFASYLRYGAYIRVCFLSMRDAFLSDHEFGKICTKDVSSRGRDGKKGRK